jgi:probable F420-dependent oxidoreductase
MRFSYAESMIDPSFYVPLARAVEEAGWASFIVPDSICYPEVSDSKYPYTPDGDRAFLEDKPFLEPFSLIPALGAVTERLRFTTFVVKLPIRHPVLVAKSAASVAVLTANRFGFGVGVSPWPDDFRICGAEWKGRGRRMDEMIEIIRGLTRPAPAAPVGAFARGGFYQFHGEFYDLESVKICPVPTRPLPILIGGHSDAALRRAARLGDGWMHAGGDPHEFERMLARLGELRRECGRDREPFEVHVISLDAYTADGVRRLEERGVTDVIVGFRNAYAVAQDTETLAQKIDSLRRYADDVIAKV